MALRFGMEIKMKRTNHHKGFWITGIILLLFAVYISVVWKVFIPSWESKNGTYIKYQEMLLSVNETYIGIIDTDRNKVRIIDHSGKEISCADTKGDSPNQIALGDRSYFLLYQNSDDGDRIVQYDYQSNKIKECSVADTATIACRGGYLFLGNWKQEGEETAYYFYPYYNSFYAHRYIAEKKFGNPFGTLPVDRRERFVVGDVDLYYHEAGYYSTEPVLDDYPVTSIGEFTADDRAYDYQAETKREEKNRRLLLKEIGEIQNVKDPVYCVSEYQEQKMIYGICNVVETLIPSRPLKPEDILKSYYYKINPEKKEITILGQTDDAIAIMATGSILVYQRGESIFQKNLSSKEERNIYQMKYGHANEVWICVDGDYLLVRERKRHMFVAEKEITGEYICWKE